MNSKSTKQFYKKIQKIIFILENYYDEYGKIMLDSQAVEFLRALNLLRSIIRNTEEIK